MNIFVPKVYSDIPAATSSFTYHDTYLHATCVLCTLKTHSTFIAAVNWQKVKVLPCAGILWL